MRFDQAQVGRNDVANTQVHEIAGNDLGDVDLGGLAITIDERQVTDLRVERLDRLLGAVLVHEAQPDAHQHDPADDQSLSAIPHNRRDHGRDKQQQQQVATHLSDKNRNGTDAVGKQHVRPVRGQAALRFDAG